ncbi:hypothetical protein [Streptomyces sp. NPDC046371]|uniref:hypothetical protein n=1 Tax=Streptomyces sp. NPDC046371 TaxID=3154916 RepID=UPI003410B5F5
MTTIGAQRTDTTGPIHDYVRALLRRSLEERTGRERRIAELEQNGHRIVGSGQVHGDAWEITDWRSGSIIAAGVGGDEAYEAATRRLDPAEMWIHIDHVDDEDLADLEHPGLPDSLAEALQDWLGGVSTTDADVAQFVGWSVEEVAQHRGEL